MVHGATRREAVATFTLARRCYSMGHATLSLGASNAICLQPDVLAS